MNARSAPRHAAIIPHAETLIIYLRHRGEYITNQLAQLVPLVFDDSAGWTHSMDPLLITLCVRYSAVRRVRSSIDAKSASSALRVTRFGLAV